MALPRICMTSSSASDANRSGYDRWSSAYDTTVNATVAADERAFPSSWAHLTGLNVLEIGCGTGRHTIKLATAGNRVTGLDLSPGMLAQARQRLAGHEGVQLIEADILAERPPVLGCFNAAVTSLVIEHLADLPLFFERMAGYLEPGSRFYLSEIHPARMQAGSGARFVDPNTGAETRLASFAHETVEVTKAAGSAGFALVSETDFVGDAAFCSLNSSWVKYLHVPMVRIWVFEKTAEADSGHKTVSEKQGSSADVGL